jgi:uncharacterized membrane protein YphA (DoxX/SURF4 family)
MRLRISPRDVPIRLSTGAYVLHAGLEKWRGDEERASALHGVAVRAYPFLGRIPPTTFLRLLASAEIVTGGLLLAPVVANRVAGAALTAFSGGLVVMYLRTPSMHKPGSIWPAPAGIGVSKDVWMLGSGLSLLADAGPPREARRQGRGAQPATTVRGA